MIVHSKRKEESNNYQVKRNGRDNIRTSAGGSMIIIWQKYKISEPVEERWRCSCIAGEEDKLC
jgi:hypothetical protein